MTKAQEAIKAAIEDIFESTLKGDYSAQERMNILARRIATHGNTIQTALKAFEALCDEGWRPIDSAPKGYDGEKFNYVLFKGYSKSGAFSGFVHISGFMDSDRKPVHFYNYKLIITHWKPLESKADKIAQKFMEGDDE